MMESSIIWTVVWLLILIFVSDDDFQLKIVYGYVVTKIDDRPGYVLKHLRSGLQDKHLSVYRRLYSNNDNTNIRKDKILNAYGSSISFHDFEGVPSWLATQCSELNFQIPTFVQQEAIPEIMNGKDIIIQAQTGSGKTLAFGVPILSKVDPNRASIQAVIVVPSRELCLQVTRQLRQLASASPKKILIMPVMEGSRNRRNILWATAEPPQIVVGNPRSLTELANSGNLRLNAVRMVVLDEVDACLIKPETRQV